MESDQRVYKNKPGLCALLCREKGQPIFQGQAWVFADDPFQSGIIHEDKFEVPFKWRNPRLVFVCSMGDLFHDAVSDDVEYPFKP